MMFGMKHNGKSISVWSTYQRVDRSWHTGWLAVWAHNGEGY